MSISAKELPLGKVFTPDFRFFIPSFQRAYIWKQENILQLVDDLREAAATPETPYFLGSLILVRRGGTRFDVIDGQQRLISLSIIIAVLRDLERDPEWMGKLDALLVEPGDKLRGIANEPRLTLRERDADFFRDHVQENNLEPVFDMSDDDLTTGAQRNIMRNIKCTYDELEHLSEDERHAFASYLVNQVTLVIVTTDDLDGAHRIFDVMNMRGLPLTPADVFKARATSPLSPAQSDAYAERWDDIIDPIGDERESEEFFGYLHLILTHQPDTNGKLIDRFLADVLQPHIDGGTIPAFIDKILAPYALAWRIIDHPSETILPAEATDRLESLDDYRNREWRAVAMWTLVHSFSKLGDPEISPFIRRGARSARRQVTVADLGFHDADRLVAVLDALERFTGVQTLNRTNPGDRRGFVTAVIRDLDRGLPLQSVRRLSFIPADDRAGALVRLHGDMQDDDDLVRLLLLRANDQKAGRHLSRPRLFSAMPIMPLNIERTHSYGDWSQEQHDHWVTRLGNMTLVQGKAKELDDHPEYPDRRERILMRANSRRFPLTDELERYSACTPQMIQSRQEETIRLIADYWGIRYDERSTDMTAKDVDELIHETAVKPSRGSRRVTILQVMRAGLITPGETLVWERPRKGERWVATVTESGKFRLQDGSEYASPTAAARAAAGGKGSGGLEVWKRSSDGRKLSEIWKEFRQRS
ncbi:GmrSD restriction endonuclease domain-containing protein [Bifidobacterium vespertilionis]|uniref:DUF262 domain-containing protein n=1 Tax=Bifidobacterium vespertilionis TaxID=2562524 RepID=A0A5J5DUJ5_9BIFI|nr:DUF262 domain-containing protein [Bifidobacterium vespertilionis]KAA8820028.1 DUF262 domain-containing protein [Bifidobacterium vespertilionis]KAA8823740.1 DUF262 domain-containing protein [Bifidobacterium vespertilionis]